MKDKLVPILIFAGVAFATYTFQDKVVSIKGLIDSMRENYADIINDPRRDANISLQYFGDTIIRSSVHAYTRYLLTPRHVSIDVSKYDTLLTVCDKRLYERAKSRIEDQRVVLMKKADNQFYYVETCKK